MTSTYRQGGKGLNDIGVLHRNPGVPQRGAGIGSVFGGLWKFLKPVVTSLGKQSLIAGGNIVQDAFAGKNMRDSLYEQGQKAISDLSQKSINRLKRLQKGEGLLRHSLDRASAMGKSRLLPMTSGRRRKRKTTCCKRKKSKGTTKNRKPVQKGGRRRRRPPSRRPTKRKRSKSQRSIDIFSV